VFNSSRRLQIFYFDSPDFKGLTAMPGILGIISQRPSAENAASLERMRRTMIHESFYTSGTYTNDKLGVWAGWVCHRGAFSDCQPIWNERRDICLIFSGENCVDPAQIRLLKGKGHEFAEGDASYLVHLYEEQGTGFLAKLNGLFSGLLVDLRENKAMLFNDRYGMNRIYYHQAKDGFYFASEAKALLKVLPELRQLEMRSVGEFFSCGCVMQNRTLFTGVFQMPGGSAWTFVPGQPVRKDAYFAKEQWESQPQLTAAQYYEKLRETWANILPRYLNGRAPLALSLTGGLDSRLILAWAPRLKGDISCYTFGGMYRDCVDLKVARQVARLCGQQHQTIPLGKEFLADFPSLVEKTVYVTDGALDPTGAADLYVQRRAREIAPVRVSGLYGGEILRALLVFKPTTLGRDAISPEFAQLAGETATTYALELQGRKLSFIAFKQAAWFIYARLAIERSQLTLRSPYFDNDLIALAFQAPPELASSKDLGLRLIADGNPALKSVETDRGLALKTVPGLTRARHLLQEFTFKAEYAYDYGMPQWLARMDSVFRPFHFEKLWLGRHKFYHYRVWYRDHLANYLKSVLLDPRARNRPYLQNNALEKMVTRHTRGVGNYTSEIHRLLALELVQRQLIEQS
jgi:asparagine synthase (glutamine-hydrolysing)